MQRDASQEFGCSPRQSMSSLSHELPWPVHCIGTQRGARGMKHGRRQGRLRVVRELMSGSAGVRRALGLAFRAA